MKIVGIELKPLSVLRVHSTRAAGKWRGKIEGPADGVTTGRERSYFALIELHADNGLVGLGEISDVGDTGRDSIDVGALRPKLEKVLLGADPFDLERIERGLGIGDPNELYLEYGTLVECAVDNALYDLQGKALGTPVHNLVGGIYRDRILVSWVVYMREPALIEEEMQEMVGRGFSCFKLKVGLDVENDDECLRVMRSVAGPGAQIKIDVSGAWSVDDAIANIKRLEKHGLQAVETPTRVDDVAGHARIRRSVGVPIIEHVGKNVRYALELVRQEAVDIFNVITVHSGGILPAKKVIALAEAAGISCLLGSTVELGVGTSAQIHLAASSPAVTYPSDLIGPALYVDDYITQPFEYAQGYLPVPTGPGLGVTVDPARLGRLANTPTLT